MQWILDAIKANTGEDGKVDLEKLDTAIKAEFPKQAVPKDQYNTVSDKLKAAQDTLTKLQDENKNVESLQTQIEDYKKQVVEKDKELATTRNKVTLKEALREAGATDIDYAIFKLGELETDGEGNIKDLENKIKGLKEADPKWFKSDDDNSNNDNKNKGGNGFTVVDNGLKGGQPPKDKEPATMREALAQHYQEKK